MNNALRTLQKVFRLIYLNFYLFEKQKCLHLLFCDQLIMKDHSCLTASMSLFVFEDSGMQAAQISCFKARECKISNLLG